MTRKPAWIVVADGAEARILSNAGRANGVVALADGQFRERHPPSRELGLGPPPRVHESMGAARHSIEPKSDPHDAGEREFLARLVAHLERAEERKAFDHLVIVAPARAMGSIRKAMGQALRRRVVHEEVHDYVHQTDDVIYARLREYLPP